MADVTLGQVTSQPNEKGEHTLKCPSCSTIFLNTITKDETSGQLLPVACSTCQYSDEPKMFIAAAHQDEVNAMAAKYVQNELNKSFKNLFT